MIYTNNLEVTTGLVTFSCFSQSVTGKGFVKRRQMLCGRLCSLCDALPHSFFIICKKKKKSLFFFSCRRYWPSITCLSSASRLWRTVRTGSRSRLLQHPNRNRSKYSWNDARWGSKCFWVQTFFVVLINLCCTFEHFNIPSMYRISLDSII